MTKYRWHWLENAWLRRPFMVLVLPIYLVWPLFAQAAQRYQDVFDEFVELW